MDQAYIIYSVFHLGADFKLARYWNPGIWQNGRLLKDVIGKYGPDIYTGFLLNFMKKNQSEPFLLYYPMTLPNFLTVQSTVWA